MNAETTSIGLIAVAPELELIVTADAYAFSYARSTMANVNNVKPDPLPGAFLHEISLSLDRTS
jgi:hypothetical protein